MHSSKETSGDRSTFLYSDDFGTTVNRHPIKALYKLIEQKNLQADLLLCPGDVANRADKQGLITGWSYLTRIKEKLTANSLVATIGNHDIESRNEDLGNVFSEIKLFDKDYPLPNVSDSYWAQGYSISEYKDVLILNLNSCFFHGNSKNALLSKVEQYQLEGIEKELIQKDASKYTYKVLLCHHHPIGHASMDYRDTDKIDRGDDLLKLVNKYKFQIIIHGHKHEPRLTIIDTLPIFCAGSFSSLMNVNDLKVDNTFHIVSLEEWASKGVIQTWVYLPKEGWVTRLDSQFPCQIGFGYNGDIKVLAEKIREWFFKENGRVVLYDKLVSTFEDLTYMNEQGQKELADILKEKYSLMFSPEFPNKPNLLAAIIQ